MVLHNVSLVVAPLVAFACHPSPAPVADTARPAVRAEERAEESREDRRECAITLERVEQGLELRIGEELFTVFRFKELEGRKPSLYPLVAPGGVEVTRDFPFAKGEGEEYDHPHHSSLWFAHGDVNGNDFWHGAKTRIVADDEYRANVVDNRATVETTFRWIDGEGEAIAEEARRTSFLARKEERLIDFEITVRPLEEPLVFGDTKEGTFGVRLAPELRLKGKVAAGHARNSEGVEGKDVWGKRARWITYWGAIDGETVGVAIFDHPKNHAHPTWWHARDYGLVAANPFGVHDFEGKPAHTGDLAVPVGSECTFRYRVMLYSGAAEARKIEAAWKAWTDLPTESLHLLGIEPPARSGDRD